MVEGARARVLCAGLATLDVVQRVDRFPGPDEKVVARRLDTAAGGPAAGAAVTAAVLGARTRLMTVLGAHPLARLVSDDLAACGVEVVDAEPERVRAPAVSSVTVLDGTGERSVVSRNAEGVAARPPDGLAGTSDVLLLDGHHPALALAAARAARTAGVPVVLDGGSWKEHLPGILPLVDVAACSSAFRLPGGEPLERLLDRGPAVVAVTSGAGPVRWWTSAGAGAVQVPEVPALDTLGAGDAFHGALAVALAGRLTAVRGPDPGPELVAALRFAVGVAAIRVQHVGPRSWLSDPRLREVRRRDPSSRQP